MKDLLTDAIVAIRHLFSVPLRSTRGADFLADLEAGYDHLEPNVPAGAGEPPVPTGAGGHPVRDTSELLSTAANFVRNYRDHLGNDGPGPYLVALDEFADELRDRAAQLEAVGD